MAFILGRCDLFFHNRFSKICYSIRAGFICECLQAIYVPCKCPHVNVIGKISTGIIYNDRELLNDLTAGRMWNYPNITVYKFLS